jgi:4-amino-4-deoxy-L-arabinose transferase-like glycosyltransferase
MTHLSKWERIGIVILLLFAWALRWVALMEVPPGWRDDDLIELYTFSLRVAEEGPQLYFPGASGHEPLYHTLRAPLVATAGVNAASARLMAAGAGTLAVGLTWALGRRLLGPRGGILAGALVTVSFWSLMYSRVAIRHMGALPWMLLTIYWGWRWLHDRQQPRGALWGIILGTAGSVLTYYAGRLMPALLVGMLIFSASRAGRWRRYLLALGIGLALTVPMFLAAARLPGADARVSEVAVPVTALLEGNLRPLIQTTWTTLGMFHARGDPEWLYNYHERPVFDPVTAIGFYLSLVLALLGWRRPKNRLLLLWLAIGLSPSFLSLPPSSYGHAILALPAVYLLLASLLPTLSTLLARRRQGRISWAPGLLGALLLLTVGARDLWGYFRLWPSHPMVRFLYRADYRALSDTLCEGPLCEGTLREDTLREDTLREDTLREDCISDIAIGSMLFGIWDKVALRTDCEQLQSPLRTEGPRWVNPARALVFAAGRATPLHLQDEGSRHPQIAALLAASQTLDGPAGMQSYRVEPPAPPDHAITRTVGGKATVDQPFEGVIALEAAAQVPADRAITLATWWRIDGKLPLPPETLIPQPPPPGVYSGPRLKVFAHLRDGDQTVSIDDGLWADPYSLRPGDLLLQFHDFYVPDDLDTADLTVQLGFYDPLTGERWRPPDGADSLVLSLNQPPALVD